MLYLEESGQDRKFDNRRGEELGDVHILVHGRCLITRQFLVIIELMLSVSHLSFSWLSFSRLSVSRLSVPRLMPPDAVRRCGPRKPLIVNKAMLESHHDIVGQ